MQVGVESVSMETGGLVKMDIVGYEKTIPTHLMDAINKGRSLYLTDEGPPAISKRVSYQATNPCREILFKEDAKISAEVAKKLAIEADRRWIKEYMWPSIQPAQKLTKYEAEFLMEDKARQAPMPHSLRVGELNGKYMNSDIVQVQGYGLNGKAEVTDEQVKVTFNLPGIEPDNIQVKRINDTIRITKLKPGQEPDFDPYTQTINHATYYLAEGEEIESVDLDLGVLTIIIDRNAEVEEFAL